MAAPTRTAENETADAQTDSPDNAATTHGPQQPPQPKQKQRVAVVVPFGEMFVKRLAKPDSVRAAERAFTAAPITNAQPTPRRPPRQTQPQPQHPQPQPQPQQSQQLGPLLLQQQQQQQRAHNPRSNSFLSKMRTLTFNTSGRVVDPDDPETLRHFVLARGDQDPRIALEPWPATRPSPPGLPSLSLSLSGRSPDGLQNPGFL